MRMTRTKTPSAPVDATTQQRRMVFHRNSQQRAMELRRDMDLIVRSPAFEKGIVADILNHSRPPRRPAREGDYLHVSDLLHKCLRKKVLGQHYGTPALPERLSISDLMAFAQGDAIHDVAKALVRDGSPALTWGRWHCTCKNLRHEEPCTYAETDPEDICEYCGTPTNVYEEVPMRDEDTMIVGTPDLLLYFRELDAFHITEIKSMSHKMFQELARPLPEHVLQVIFYWWLMRKLGYRITDQVSIIYFTKDYLFVGKNYKEFMITPEQEIHRLDRYIADAYAYKAAKVDRDANLPARVCQAEHSTEAKKCSMCEICFSRE